MGIHTENIGKIIFAGAGPGDPELITLKALRYIKQADVIVTDRLVSEDLLSLARKGALILYAGKQGGESASVPQYEINNWLVTHALQNKLVLRLKGGDVTIYANLLDELESISAYKIPFEIIPGITAASGASAYAGIPLTARGFANAIRILTCYDLGLFNATAWKDLASTDDTLVFYMSSNTFSGLVKKLMEHHIAIDKSVAVIEQATTPQQRVRVFNFDELGGQSLSFVSPTILIIGRVARFHEQFKWMPDGGSQYYFTPVKDRINNLIAIPS